MNKSDADQRIAVAAIRSALTHSDIDLKGLLLDYVAERSAPLKALIADVAFEDPQPSPGPNASPIGGRRRT